MGVTTRECWLAFLGGDESIDEEFATRAEAEQAVLGCYEDGSYGGWVERVRIILDDEDESRDAETLEAHAVVRHPDAIDVTEAELEAIGLHRVGLSGVSRSSYWALDEGEERLRIRLSDHPPRDVRNVGVAVRIDPLATPTPGLGAALKAARLLLERAIEDARDMADDEADAEEAALLLANRWPQLAKPIAAP